MILLIKLQVCQDHLPPQVTILHTCSFTLIQLPVALSWTITPCVRVVTRLPFPSESASKRVQLHHPCSATTSSGTLEILQWAEDSPDCSWRSLSYRERRSQSQPQELLVKMHNSQEIMAPSTSYCCQISVHWTCLQNFRYQTLVKLEASGETKEGKSTDKTFVSSNGWVPDSQEKARICTTYLWPPTTCHGLSDDITGVSFLTDKVIVLVGRGDKYRTKLMGFTTWSMDVCWWPATLRSSTTTIVVPYVRAVIKPLDGSMSATVELSSDHRWCRDGKGTTANHHPWTQDTWSNKYRTLMAMGLSNKRWLRYLPDHIFFTPANRQRDSVAIPVCNIELFVWMSIVRTTMS